jgi:two-component system CheB/CheR fusion protein
MTDSSRKKDRPGRSEPLDGPVLVAALGASAGGLEALEDFFDHMPTDSGVAFVVIQHLDRSRESIGPELLGGHTRMPVRQAEEGDVLLADHVYVTPPDAWMTVREGTLHLERPEAHGPPTVVDRFFRSLAEDQGRRAVAILLSGAGSDGAVGIGRVREAGGLAMVQDPVTARFDSMPRHGITSARVTDVLPPAGLATRLAEHAERVGAGRAEPGPRSLDLSEAAFDRVATVLQRETGHDFSRYKSATILRRLTRRIQLRRCAGLDEYLTLIADDPEEAHALYEDLLIGVTDFFRDPEVFRALREREIPRIVEEHGPGRPIRIWVPGCGTGQETYSLAMLFAEAMRDRPEPPPVKIFATDVNESALAVARRAAYPQGIAEEVPPELLERYFRAENGELRIADEIREECIFATHDLLFDPPFSDLDLISCRNLFIYFRPEAQNRLVPLFHFALRPGGVLLLGPSERVTGHESLFREVEGGHQIFRRREPTGALSTPFTLRRTGVSTRGSRSPAGERSRHTVGSPAGAEGRVRELERVLLNEFTPPCVMVDDDHRIVHYQGRTGNYLEPASGRPSDALLDMARPGLRHHLRTALTEAAATGETVVRPGVMVETAEGWEHVDITVRPVKRDGDGANLYLVLFQAGAAPAQARTPGGSGPAAGSAEEGGEARENRVIEELELELHDMRDQLQATILEVETANEELRAANEELISMNEELQSSNEELQTAEEEAQSVNEELVTVNAELNQKIGQLKEVHSDLDNLFRSTQIATIFLDDRLNIRRFTPAAMEIFRLKDSDAGRPIRDITSRIVGRPDLVLSDVRRVLDTLEPVEREVWADEGGECYSMRIFPYRTVDDVIDGVALTFVNITRVKQLEHEKGRLAAIVEGMHDAVVGRRPDGTITSWNEGASRLFGYAPEEILGRSFSLLVPEDREEETRVAVEEVLRGDWTAPIETTRLTRAGERMDVSVNLAPIRDREGEVVAISETARDITARIVAERAVREAERRKDEFLTMLGHELRNPLGTIRSSVDILMRTGSAERGAEEAELVEILDRQVGYLAALVDDLTDAARLTSGRFSLRLEPVDLWELVRKSAEDYRGFAERSGVELEADVPGGSLWLEADRTRLAQVLGNLLQNACKYAPAGVRIVLEARREDGAVVVSVRDEGPGLEEDELEGIFGLFERGSRSRSVPPGEAGLGLGLPVARRLVELHGGTLRAASEGVGRGSTFTIRLPLTRTLTPESGAPRPGRAGAAGAAGDGAPPRRVLVVEDNQDVAHTLERLLRTMGHEVFVAYEARSALALARDERPEVLLCDISLPGDMDGYGVARVLRGDPDTAGIRLVAVTGYGRDVDRDRAREAGFDEHLTKPVTADSLDRVLRD